jgi:hypothetical protein
MAGAIVLQSSTEQKYLCVFRLLEIVTLNRIMHYIWNVTRNNNNRDTLEPGEANVVLRTRSGGMKESRGAVFAVLLIAGALAFTVATFVAKTGERAVVNPTFISSAAIGRY